MSIATHTPTPRADELVPVPVTERPASPEVIYGRIMGAFSRFAKAMLALMDTPKADTPESIATPEAFAAWHSARWERQEAESAVRTAESWLIEQIPPELVDVEFIYSADTSFRLGKDKRIHIRNTTLTA